MSTSNATTHPSRRHEDRVPRPVAADVPDADLGRLLVRAATGDVGAFVAFYDATCAVTWRLELCRHGDQRLAKEAMTARYVAAWLQAASQAGSGLSARAWLLSLATDLPRPASHSVASRLGA